MALTPLDFPASPTVGQLYPDPPVTGQPTYRWDGAQWLSYAAASLPTPTKPANYGKKNYIINGAMQVNQENSGLGPVTTNGSYPVDQFVVFFVSSGTFNAGGAGIVTPAGSPIRLQVNVTAADAAVAAGDIVWVMQTIEGLRCADLRFGTAAAKTVTLQFGVKAPAGTYCVSIRNAGNTRSYVAEYVIAAGEANTDVVKSVTFTGDISGTWATDNTAGLLISWTLMAGTTYQTPAGVWTGGNFFATSNQFNFMGTVNNRFELFDVSLTEGTVAPPFQVPDYADELAACQRYYWKGRFCAGGYGLGGAPNVCGSIMFPVTMRGTPTVIAISSNAPINGTLVLDTASVDSFRVYGNPTSTGNWYIDNILTSANARL